MSHSQTKLLLLVLFVAWVSSITMLVPWPPTTIEYVRGYDMRVAEWPIWTRWILQSAFVMAGAFAALLAYRGSSKALKYAVGLSALYIAWWLSEYLLAKSPLTESIARVVHHLQVGDTTSRLVVAQHQLVLPIVHLVFVLITMLGYGKRRVAI